MAHAVMPTSFMVIVIGPSKYSMNKSFISEGILSSNIIWLLTKRVCRNDGWLIVTHYVIKSCPYHFWMTKYLGMGMTAINQYCEEFIICIYLDFHQDNKCVAQPLDPLGYWLNMHPANSNYHISNNLVCLEKDVVLLLFITALCIKHMV